MAANTEMIQEISEHLEKCDFEKLTSINQLSKIMVTLSAAQLNYLLDLSNLLFCQPPQ